MNKSCFIAHAFQTPFFHALNQHNLLFILFLTLKRNSGISYVLILIIFGIDKFFDRSNIVIKTKDDKIARVRNLKKTAGVRF